MVMVGGLSGLNLNSPWESAYITQTGLIAADANSLRLLASGPFEIQVNGSVIPMLPVSGYEYAGDISAFAGRTAELRIVNTHIGMEDRFENLLSLDNIQFSSQVVPEPSVVLLFLLGVAVFRIRKLARNR